MIVGLTGGIGSGKTTVAKIFAHLGIAIYDSDSAAKRIMDTDDELKHQLQTLIGTDVLDENRLINKPFLAKLIFNDDTLLAKVNGLIHPAVGRDFKNWVAKQDSKYVIKEAAILYESQAYKACDKVVVVTAPQEMRIERVMKRSGISREEVEDRMAKQWPDEKKVELADYVIYNDQSKSIIKQVLVIHEDLISQSNSRIR